MKKNREELRIERLERAVELRRKSGLVRGELLNLDEAVEYSHLGKDSLYECVKKALIRAVNPPIGPLMFDSADIDEYIKKSVQPVKAAGRGGFL